MVARTSAIPHPRPDAGPLTAPARKWTPQGQWCCRREQGVLPQVPPLPAPPNPLPSRAWGEVLQSTIKCAKPEVPGGKAATPGILQSCLRMT